MRGEMSRGKWRITERSKKAKIKGVDSKCMWKQDCVFVK